MAARLSALGASVILLALASPSLAAAGTAGAASAGGGPEAAEPAPDAKDDGRPEPAATSGEAGRSPFGAVTPGLDLMARAETATDFSVSDFAFTPRKDESRILVRARPSLSFGPSGFFRARLEGQWYGAFDGRDLSRFSVYQGFVEASLPVVEAVAAKVGRQEFVHGSAFMLGADTFYDGLSFDAVKLSVKPSKSFSVDAFGGQYVTSNSGGVEGKLHGVYATFAPRKTASVEIYGFDDTGRAAVDAGGAHERTYSLGTRVCVKGGGRVDIEIEPVWQFGRTGVAGAAREDVRAFGGHIDVAIPVRVGGRSGNVFLSYAYGSGDGDPDDGTFREFRDPDNDTPLIGGMHVVGDLSGLQVAGRAASGLRIARAGWAIDATRKLNVSVDGHYFRADRAPAGVRKDIGVETDFVLTCKFSEGVSLLLSADRFFAGGFFKDAAGSARDIGYYYLQVLAGL